MTSLSGTTWTVTAPQRNFMTYDISFHSDGTATAATKTNGFSATGKWIEHGDAGLFSAMLTWSNGGSDVLSGHHADGSGAGVDHSYYPSVGHYSMNFLMDKT